MRDNEMIEEITKIINIRCEAELGQVHTNSKDGKVTKTVDTSLIAKDIYKYLTEKAVVITRKEYDDYQDLFKNFDDYLFEYRRFADNRIKETREETARAFLYKAVTQIKIQ